MTARIIQLSELIQQYQAIRCAAIDITFPPLYRVVQSLPAHNDYIHYTLSNDDTDYYPGSRLERSIIRGIPDRGAQSLICQWHKNHEVAMAYLDGVNAISGTFSNSEPIYQNTVGVFTLLRRPTLPRWPHPLVIYSVTSVPADNRWGEDSWSVAVAPDGKVAPFDDWVTDEDDIIIG